MTSPWTFTPRWKEELVCECAEGKLVIDMTMGVVRVYFPSEERWNTAAPPWARPRYVEILAALREWCGDKTPLVVDDSGWVQEEKTEDRR